MRHFPMLFLLLSAILIQPGLAEDRPHPHKAVSEATVRIVSDMTYAEILRQAVSKGWTYTAEQIKSGQKRHFEEFKLQLINEGYEIIVGESEI